MLEVINLKRMLHMLCASTLIALFAACAPQQQAPEANRVFEREGGFSYVPPAGWKVQRASSFKYQIVIGPASNGFTPNMNFLIEDSNMPFQEYVDLSKANIPKLLPNSVVKSSAAFDLKSGSSAAKIIWDTNINQNNIRINSYLVDGKTRKFVITCGRALTQPTSIDVECDQAASSFRIE